MVTMSMLAEMLNGYNPDAEICFVNAHGHELDFDSVEVRPYGVQDELEHLIEKYAGTPKAEQFKNELEAYKKSQGDKSKIAIVEICLLHQSQEYLKKAPPRQRPIL